MVRKAGRESIVRKMHFIPFALTTLIYYLFFLLALDGIACHEANETSWVKLEKASNIICQNEVLTMQCPNYESIHILPDAFWGRDDNVTCQEPTLRKGEHCSHTKMCIPEDTMMDDEKIRRACHKEQFCILVANNYFFRFEHDICPEVCKYIRFNYECRQMSGMRKSLVGHIWNWIGKLKKLIDSGL